MTLSLQALYPVADGTTFDHAYYATRHMALIDEHMGAHLLSVHASKGLSGGPDQPAAYHAIATLVFADQAAMDAALAVAAPVMADVPNYYNAAPVMLFGQVLD